MSPGRCSTWVKLDDVSADYVVSLPSADILERVLTWAQEYDKDLASVVGAERELALRALAVEREGTENKCSYLRKWADFRPVYGFPPGDLRAGHRPVDERFNGLDPDLVRAMASGFAAGYVEPGPDVEWFETIRILAGELGFALRQKGHKHSGPWLPHPGLDRRRRRRHPGADHLFTAVARGSPRSPPRLAGPRCCAGSGRCPDLPRLGGRPDPRVATTKCDLLAVPGGQVLVYRVGLERHPAGSAGLRPGWPGR